MDELEAEGIPFNKDIEVGIMIEVPAAVMIAEFLAEEVDFSALGRMILYSLRLLLIG